MRRSASGFASDTSAQELGVMVAMAPLAMLFGSLLLAACLLRVRQPVWPPIGAESAPIVWSLLATLALGVSSYLLHLSLAARAAGDAAQFRKYWRWASVLGLLFLALQSGFWSQFWHIGQTLSSNLFASIIYALTGIHAVHVLLALGLLLWVAIRPPALESHRPRWSAWIWHFLGLAWLPILLFVCI